MLGLRQENFSSYDVATKWSEKMYTNTEDFDDTVISSYLIKDLPETLKEALLRKTDVTMEEKNESFKNINNG